MKQAAFTHGSESDTEWLMNSFCIRAGLDLRSPRARPVAVRTFRRAPRDALVRTLQVLGLLFAQPGALVRKWSTPTFYLNGGGALNGVVPTEANYVIRTR